MKIETEKMENKRTMNFLLDKQKSFYIVPLCSQNSVSQDCSTDQKYNLDLNI